MPNKPEPFNHEIGVELVKLIPEEVRDDHERLEAYVNLALEFGLKAMLTAGGGIDTAYVGKEFENWKNAVSGKLIGKDSDFEMALDDWFENSDGSFQKALNLEDPNSPLSRFMDKQKTDRTTHEASMKLLVEEIKTAVIKDSAPKQAKEQGDQFEEDITWFLNNVKVMDDDVEQVGESEIEGTDGAKTGDVLIKVSDPSANNLRIATEAKSGKSGGAYSLTGKETLWDEMSKSMVLREAQASIGVVNIDNVKKHQPWLTKGRYQIIVAVDWENMDFTLLEIAYNVLRYRIIQDAFGGNTVTQERTLDFVGFDELLTGISDSTEILRKMRGNLTGISNIVDGQNTDINQLERTIKSNIEQLKLLLSSAQTEEISDTISEA